MAIDDKIRHKKPQYDITEAAKISALRSGKIDKYEYFTGQEMLPSEKKVIEKEEITYSLLQKAEKNPEDQGEKQI